MAETTPEPIDAPDPPDAPNPVDPVDPDAPADRRPLRGERDVVLAVALGGIVGAECRYGIDRLIAPTRTGFPFATFVINVSGCLAMGVLMVVLTELVTPRRLLRPFLGIGILGGFTTFSGFTVDTVRLVDAHRTGLALGYVVGTLAAAAGALALATGVTRRLSRSGRRDEPGRPGRSLPPVPG